jgi:hypothetical protein
MKVCTNAQGGYCGGGFVGQAIGIEALRPDMRLSAWERSFKGDDESVLIVDAHRAVYTLVSEATDRPFDDAVGMCCRWVGLGGHWAWSRFGARTVVMITAARYRNFDGEAEVGRFMSLVSCIIWC